MILALAHRAAAEPLHLRTPSSVQTDGGSTLRLPPGYFIEERVWSDLDLELRRLQDAETRLTVENSTMRKQVASWQPGWYTLGTAVAIGLVGGFWIHSKI